MKLLKILLVSTFLACATHGEDLRVEPPFWWTGMPTESLQLQLYGPNIGMLRASSNSPHVTILRQNAVDSPNYLFLYLNIGGDAKPGPVEIALTDGSRQVSFEYELRTRDLQQTKAQGFDAADMMYLLMPDRFANGDVSNDSISDLIEGVNRNDPTKRQGGDLKGIRNNLDYIQNLGATAVWFTPVLENDMSPEYGAYHGYAATDMYRIDRRFGSNEEYRALVESIHGRGMKVIMDMIHNHVGINHWWMSDLPCRDWVHDLSKVGLTNFRGTISGDPNASEFDRNELVQGWFVNEMPDLDQRNPLLADYLIQNTIWWIEYSGIDGIRMDTYLYPYPEYMARWAKEILQAYPNFNIVGEAWCETVAQESYWQYDRPGVDDGYNSHLPSVTDFPFCFAVRTGLKETFSRDTGLGRIYNLFSQDRLYTDPNKNVIFLDNHDMGRVYEEFGQDAARTKMAYAILATSRGIPVIYYGSELLMGHEHRGGDDEAWRQTMPGGWPGDARSVFRRSGRTDAENGFYDYAARINHWRKSCPSVQQGKMVQFYPKDNIFVYFRVLPEQATMVVINGNDSSVDLPVERFAEILTKFSSGRDIVSDTPVSIAAPIQAPAKAALIIELNP